jgi:hypothetical protein
MVRFSASASAARANSSSTLGATSARFAAPLTWCSRSRIEECPTSLSRRSVGSSKMKTKTYGD